jgi:hypothetical protein
MDVKLCKPSKDSYIIIESVHGSDLFRLGEVTQVYRQIIGFCNFQSFLFDGERLGGNPSAWHYVRHFVSRKQRITTAPTGKNGLYYVYRGVSNAVKPLNSVLASGLLSKQFSLGAPRTPFTWGRDPIPHMRLHERSDVHFVMPGNNPPPTAFAIYTPDSGAIQEVRDPLERKAMLKKLVESGREGF